MKVFLDTNILLDLLLEREGYVVASQILQLKEEGRIELCVSFLTMVNVAYVYRKTVGQDRVVPNLKLISSLMEVLSMGDDILQQALYLNGKDFEDSVQYLCAAQNHCDCVVTRNIADFQLLPGLAPLPAIPPAYTPADFLKRVYDPT